VRELVQRAARPDFTRFEAQLRSSGHCARPVQLQGRIETCDGHGQRRVWSTDTEPDGILRKACGNRREAVCPSCAERYRGDAYQLIAAGLRGGKGVPDSVAEHPAVFFTLTAPSFGLVHARPLGPDGRPRRCRPRRDALTCEHGVRLSCARVHDEDDPCLGEPICLDCFDHEGAVGWNNVLGELWRRTGSIYLPRTLARHLGMTQKALRERVRVAYVKVAEYQKRGLVHLHVIARLDRAMPDYRADQLRCPDRRFTAALLEQAVRDTVADVDAPVPDELGGGRVGWGRELDVRELDRQERREVAGYLAKYATKSTEQAGGLLHRIDRDQIDQAPVREHVRRYLRAAFTLDDTCKAAAKQRPVRQSAPRRPPGAQPASDPNALARRALHAVSHGERVRIRLHNGSEHTGCIARWALAGQPAELVLDTGETIALADVKVIAPAEPPSRRNSSDRRLAACAHQLGYRGHCLTKSRRYSTTLTALRQAREQHIHEQLLARSTDPVQRALAGAEERITSFRYVGQGHLTAADALLAASAAARAREHRRLALEERAMAAMDRQTARREA
jgi:Replication initiator protein, pSAM2